MAVIVYPIDAVSGAPLFTGRQAREAMSALMAGATPARPLGARTGVRPGTSVTTVTATSTTWTVGSHSGILDLEVAADAGPYPYAVNTVGGLPSGPMTAAHATLARVDIVYMRVDDPAEADGSALPLVAAAYLANPTAGTGTPPATPARSMVLATINVPASGGGAPSVTWVAPYAVAAGAQIPVASQAERDAIPLRDGLHVYRLDTHRPEYYNGSAWIAGSIPLVSWASSGDVNAAVGGTILIPSTLIPAVGYTTRVHVLVEGVAGFNASASAVGVTINGSIAPVASTPQHNVYAAASQWTTVTRSAYMDVPASTAATVAVVSSQSIASCWFSVNMILTRVAT